TTAASKILKNFRSTFTATAVKRLEAAGYAIIGKTNCDEFAMGSSTEYSASEQTRNPWDTTRVPGGSSGGSAAAVAPRIVDYAHASDTGGSNRQPASFCGIVGLKPTYGRVSRFGLIAYGSSLDSIGPMTRTVSQAAELLAIMAGRDPLDATSSPLPVPAYQDACGRDIAGVTIGVPSEYFAAGVDPRVQNAVHLALSQFASLGAIVQEISLPLTPAAVPVYYLIAKAEASTNLARYDALRFAALTFRADTLVQHYLQARSHFGPEVKRAILMGTYALSAGHVDGWYKQASKVRTLIRREFERAFTQVDVIAGPTAPEVAFPLGAKMDNPLSMYLSDSLTVPQSVAGLPAISVPCGFIAALPNGRHSAPVELPVGLQLTAPPFQEERLFQVAHAYEQATGWHEQTPPSPK
ncbi:MAG: Asp-tRNA(Asn)/Glu-tRNA(Gln) amidotransferase subunit GatA, partial [Candidatus Andersenbacteria bacterium]|nr:Asp-tRNA(Asn)/Glu-tRNA(Gln) amidotransferase subunit GatA [Candidatus Andersenbacteria bacterium]